jgi:hypothetical protein
MVLWNVSNHSLQEKRSIEAVILQQLINNCHRSMYYRQFIQRFKRLLLAIYFLFCFLTDKTNLFNYFPSFIFTFPSSQLGITLSRQNQLSLFLVLSQAAPIALSQHRFFSLPLSLSLSLSLYLEFPACISQFRGSSLVNFLILWLWWFGILSVCVQFLYSSF